MSIENNILNELHQLKRTVIRIDINNFSQVDKRILERHVDTVTALITKLILSHKSEVDEYENRLKEQ